jgi:hypothetical protein
MDIAWQEGGVRGTRQQATLALIPKGGDYPVDVLVWIVRYDGACLMAVGRPDTGQNRQCVHQPYWTVIGAQMGNFIMSWTEPE